LWSPVLAWFGGLFLLGLLSRNASDSSRRMIGALLVITIATITASRKFGLSFSDDFAGSYYPAFIEIAQGNFDVLLAYGKGLEVGTPLLWLGISIFRPDATSSELIFWTSFLSVGLFWLWLEIHGLEDFGAQNKGTVIAFSLLMCAFFLSSQLVRQFFSSTILLFAISNKGIGWKMVFLIGASLFHLTALPIYLFIQYARRGKLAPVVFVLCGVFFALFTNQFVEFVMSNPDIPGFEKSLYLLYNEQTFTASDLNAGKYLAVVSAFSIFTFHRQVGLGKTARGWRRVLLLTTFFYGVFLVIPQFSLRSTLVIAQLLLGWLFALVVAPLNWKFARVLFLVVLLHKFIGLVWPSSDAMGFWGQFHYWNWYPGYFFYN